MPSLPRTLVFIARSFVRLCGVLNQIIETQNQLTYHMIALEKRQKDLERKLNELNRH